MNGDEQAWGDRGISLAVGTVLMLLITLLLASVTAVSLSGIVQQSEEKLEVQAIGAYEFEVRNDEKLHISPANLDINDARIGIQINGNPAYEWNGQDPLELTCLYPGDEILIVSKKGGLTSIVDRKEMKESTKCDRLSKLPEKFKYAFVDDGGSSKKVRIADGFPFTLGIDPDGEKPDSTAGKNTHKRNISTIPFTNPWHYYKRYKRGVGPFDEGPVWLIIMVDNVHWKEDTAFDSYNWTDDPPNGTNPGANAYNLTNGWIEPIDKPSTEPTNDIYLLFKPRCKSEADHSTLAVVAVTADYQNDILFQGTEVIDDTSPFSGPVNRSIEEKFAVEPRDC